MGHADITTTMDIYNEATKDKRWSPLQGLRVKSRYDENGACHNTVAGSLIFE